MARPNWEYIRVDVLLPGHPKLAGLPRSARWTLIELWCFAGRYHTDGFISDDVWKETGPAPDRRKLVERALAEKVDGGYQMHDYTGHQRSKDEIEELSARRSEAGKRAAAARWGSDRDTKSHPPRTDDAVRPACDSMPEAEAEAEALKDQDLPPPAPSSRVPPEGPKRHATATRLPAAFTVTPGMAAWATEHVPNVDNRRETERFRDYWNSASGARARKADWEATWRNWMRRADDDKARQPRQRQSRTEEIAGIFDDNYRIAEQIEEWEAVNDANGIGEAGGVRPRALPAAGD